jgi:hypothetical protein
MLGVHKRDDLRKAPATQAAARLTGASTVRATAPSIRVIVELPSPKNVTTTMIYTYVLNKGGHGVRSPAVGL